MILLANFMIALGKVLGMALDIYMWVIIIRALVSWVSPDPFNPIVRLLARLTDPVLRPIRRIIPFKNIGIDISPILALIVIYFVKYFLVASLVEYGYRIKLY